MKKKIVYILILTAMIFSFNTCNDPVFYGIFDEVAPLDPFIPGAPTNFAVMKNSNDDQVLFVASGKNLYKYDGNRWTKYADSIGRIYSIAVIDTELYILYEGSSNVIYKCFFDSTLEFDYTIIGNPRILYAPSDLNNLNIYTANDALFIGAKDKNNNYSILSYDGTNVSKILDTGSELLKGAAYDGSNYYLITKDQINRNKGSCYSSTDPSSTSWSLSSSTPSFMGIIELPDNTVVAIDRNGRLYELDGTTVTQYASFPSSPYANGTLAIYEKDNKYLLLAGRQDTLAYTTSSGYIYGYMEMQLTDNGGLNHADGADKTFREPGTSNRSLTTSVEYGKNELFRSTIGKYNVESICQFNGVLLASTTQEGAWSYRVHPRREKNGWHWNAETQED